MIRGSLRRTLAILTLPALLALSACSSDADAKTEDQPSSETVTIEHAQGTEDVPVSPERVVVFDMSVLQSMTDLGIDAIGVPQMSDGYLPESLAKYDNDDFAKVGSLFEPDYEAVNALEPDLIIVAARSAATLPELQKIAPTIDLTVDQDNYLESAKERNLQLGEIFDATDQVTERLAALDELITETEEKAPEIGPGLILRVEAKEVTAYGPGSRYGLIHDLGIAPVSDDFVSDVAHGDAVTFEFIHESNPSIMFVQDREALAGDTSGPNASIVLDNDLVNKTEAAKEDNIVYLELFTWYLAPSALSSLEAQVETVNSAVS